MKRKILFASLAFLTALAAGCGVKNVRYEGDLPSDPNKFFTLTDNKIVIYQMMTRLFGNKVTNNVKFGTIAENGVGKFNDITPAALQALKDLGITHVWYTGVIAHAQMEDYTAYGIPLDDADVVKGRAGSPYAVKDYYDVDPDLAVDVRNRMKEFEALLKRTHDAGLKALIDFVPNHVARGYHSIMTPAGIKPLGVGDDTSVAFSPNNNFYYLPGQPFQVPAGYNPLGASLTFPTEDGKFAENPAKATGNDVFKAQPGVGDWFETVKLNYGVDIQNGRKTYFNPVPNTWTKMVDILKYWAKKGVDGFRCDMAEMVPVEFWAWAIPQVKAVNPNVVFIAEIYSPGSYRKYMNEGKFDYLYDKVGLYDALKPLIIGNSDANASGVYFAWRNTQDIGGHMVRFLENHDELRVASRQFGKNPWNAIPAMAVSAALSSGPVMIYFGQELGEQGTGYEGFSGNDGKTTIFDYWGVPTIQAWMNGGAFDGGRLTADQQKLRGTYKKLLNLVRSNDALRVGNTYDLNFANKNGISEGYDSKKVYSFLRFVPGQAVLVVANFAQTNAISTFVKIPQEAWDAMKLPAGGYYELSDLFQTDTHAGFYATNVIERRMSRSGVPLTLAPNSVYFFELKSAEPPAAPARR